MAPSLVLLCCLSLSLITQGRAENCNGEGSLRLVGWLEADAGRLEVCHNGEWGTVCVDESLQLWSHKNAEVACRNLGYGGALNSLYHNTIPSDKRVMNTSAPIHYSRVRCSGEQDSLFDCPMSEATGQCTHDQDAAIVCRRGQTAGDVRLVGDERDTAGAVELYYPQIGWTAVCADPSHAHMWRNNEKAAEIVCSQLGYLGGTPSVESLERSAVRDRLVVVGSCGNTNTFDLIDCDTSTIDDCSTDELAWIECSPTGSDGGASVLGSEREGLMQVQYGGRLGFVCDNDWDGIDARVTCREVFEYSNNADTSPEGDYTEYISNLKPIWLGGIECTDKVVLDGEGRSRTEVVESEIEECDHSEEYPIGLTECNFEIKSVRRQRIAQVDCGTGLSSSAVAAIAGACVGALILCTCCICCGCFMYEEHERRAHRRKTVCERVCFRDLCKVPSPVSRCVKRVRAKLSRPSKVQEPPVGDRPGSPTTTPTASTTQYTATTANTEYEMPEVPAREADKTSGMSITHHTEPPPDYKPERDLTTEAPPSYAQSSKYPIPSLSAIQTTI